MTGAIPETGNFSLLIIHIRRKNMHQLDLPQPNDFNPTSDEAKKVLLQHLGRGAKWGYYWRIIDNKKINTRHPTDHIPNPPLYQEGHLCFGILRTTDFYVIDFGGNKESAPEAIANVPLPLSLLIDSGGGFQCYWLLDQLQIITGENQLELARLQEGWVNFAHGEPASKDLARVLKAAGSNLSMRQNEVCEFERILIG